jgi:hypothetical protein
MIIYSHVWDLFLKLALIGVLLALFIALRVDQLLGVPAMIAILVVLWLAIYRQGLSTIASWLYARWSLGADVTMGEAHQLARLFQLDLSGKWVPLEEVKRLPKAERRSAVLAALQRLGPGRRAMLV